MDLSLTNEQANNLIKLLKKTITSVTRTLVDGDHGQIKIGEISETTSHQFILYYFYALDNIHLNFTDFETKLTLVRINLDSKFHKNANREYVRGNRVEIYDVAEFQLKDDGHTYYRAYKLPYDGIADTEDFIVALQELFKYTNLINHDSISLRIDTSLKFMD